MKLLVETTGAFGLRDKSNGQTIASGRPSVVEVTPFIEANLGGKLRVLAELTDDASDQMLCIASDMDAAIAALPRHEAPLPPPLDEEHEEDAPDETPARKPKK